MSMMGLQKKIGWGGVVGGEGWWVGGVSSIHVFLCGFLEFV